jgi:hypothetical protein
MPVNRHFFMAIGCGVALGFVSYFGLLWLQLGAATQSSRWCFEINQRKQQLASACLQPKLLLVGGSGVLFGISAHEIQERTGTPTFNLGTHAALGADYILNLTQRVARPGDTVLLALEYELFQGGAGDRGVWTDDLFVDYVVARDPGFVRHLPLETQFELGMRMPFERFKRGLKNLLRAEKISKPWLIYSVQNLNENGDQTGHVSGTRRPDAAHMRRLNSTLTQGIPSQSAGFESVRKFCDWARSKRIRVLATLPVVVQRKEYDSEVTRNVLQGIESFYRSIGVPVLGTSQDVMLPERQFYDSHYHLTEEAALSRTRRLLTSLAPLLKQGPSPGDRP